jgi:DNA-binding transcriptional LysR family regulator
MSEVPRITLEQWRALIAVVDEGGYARAAESLHKSQSSVTYAVQKLQSQLDVKAFEIRGRKAALTDTGRLLYQRAKLIIEEALGLERSAKRLSAGWEPEISLAVEVLFPTWLLLAALDRFGVESPHTHIEVYESVMGGTREVLEQDRVDFAITPHVPPGFEASQLMRMRLVPVAHPGHPLHQLKRKLTIRDLRRHRQLVIRDTGAKRDKRMSFVEAKQRWTVGHMATSILAATLGYGFAWFPEEKIRDEVAAGLLKPLPLADGGERFAEVYIVFRDRESAGPGTMRLAGIIRACVDEQRKARPRK